MFYVLTATRARLRAAGAFAARPEPNLAALLDLVALGTVADVVRLDQTNRTFVAQGLGAPARRTGATGRAGPVRGGRARRAPRHRVRPGLRRRAAPQRRRPAGRHGARHPLPADRRSAGGAAARRRARSPQPDPARSRGDDAGAGGGRPGRGRRRRPPRAVRVPPRLAPGRRRHRRVAAQGPLPPAHRRVRARGRRHAARLRPLDRGLSPARCAGPRDQAVPPAPSTATAATRSPPA